MRSAITYRCNDFSDHLFYQRLLVELKRSRPHPLQELLSFRQPSILEIPDLGQIDMAVEVTLTLPENLVEYAKRLGDATQRDVAAILADALEMLLPTWENCLKIAPIQGYLVFQMSRYWH